MAHRNVGGFALTLTHQLQFTVKPSPKSLPGFGGADLECLVGTGSSFALLELQGGQGRPAPEHLERAGSTRRVDREFPVRTRS